MICESTFVQGRLSTRNVEGEEVWGTDAIVIVLEVLEHQSSSVTIASESGDNGAPVLSAM